MNKEINNLTRKYKNIVKSILRKNNREIKYNIERCSLDRQKNILEISGWACISDIASENSKIYIKLISNINNYTFPTIIQKRPDVTKHFNNLNFDTSGFYLLLPLDEIEEKEYEIVIIVKNDNFELSQHTNKKINIKPGNPNEIKLPASSERKLNYHIDSLILDEEIMSLEITGWAYIDNMTSVNSIIYVVFKSDRETYIFETTPQKRPDITEHFKTFYLSNSGFYISINYDNFGEGEYRIGIYIKKDTVEGLTYTDRTIKKSDRLPLWLIEEWKEIHKIEPELFPDRHIIKTIPFYKVPNTDICKSYIELCNLYGDNVSHVFLVPWLIKGGADLVSINYVKALKHFKSVNNIVVIATSNKDSPWAEKLPEGVRFIEFGKLYAYLSSEEQEKLITRLLIQMKPKVIHNINSELGYTIFSKYGGALAKTSKLFACSFCEDMTDEGKSIGYAFTYLPKCYKYLEGIFSDNNSFLEKLNNIYLFNKEKLYVHYQPVEIPPKRNCIENSLNKEHLDILWAGRIDRQKRPDILCEIARYCQNMPFTFHVYGNSVLDNDIYTRYFSTLKNIQYYGSYNGLNTLPVHLYDVFLYTSQWDGIPNTLLEAISLGLPVIASNVGGISELIINEKTGFLVDPYDNINKYLDCLIKIYNNRNLTKEFISNSQELICKRHSWDNFLEKLKKISIYINCDENK